MSGTKSSGITVMHLVMFAVSFGLLTVGSWFALTFSVGIPGVTSFFWPEALIVAFSTWFGVWAILAIIPAVGLGGTMAGSAALFSFVLALLVPMEGILPAAAFRVLGANPELKSKRDWGIFLGMSIIGTSIAAAFGICVEVVFGYIPGFFTPAWWIGWLAWALGDFLMAAILGSLILKGLTPVVKRAGLYLKTWWH